MKQIRKILSLVLILASGAIMVALTKVSTLAGILNFAKEFFDYCVRFITSWSGLKTGYLIAKIGVVAANSLLLVLALVSLVKSLVKCRKKLICGPLDSLNLLTLVFVFVLGEYILRTHTTNRVKLAIVVGACGLLVLLFEIVTLALTKPEKKVELVKEQEAVVPEKTEEVAETKENEEKVEEVKEVPCTSLLGKTLQVSAGNDVLKVVVVEVNDNKVIPVVSASEVKSEVVEDTVSAKAVIESNDEEDEENPTSEKKPSLSYVERLNQSEDSLKESYSVLKNELLKHRKVHARISKSCETFRVGYDEVAKIVVAGKGLKLYLALDPFAVDSAIYHQRDAASKKRFQHVPFVVKVKSPLSVKKACQLINLTCEKKEIQPKSRYEQVDYSHIEVGQ